jgi:WD40 repeat protein
LAVACDDHTVRLIDRHTGQAVRTLRGHHDWARACRFSPDGKTLVTAGNDGQVLLWRLESDSEPAVLQEKGRAMTAAAFSPDGSTLATVGFDDVVRMFDTTTGSVGDTCPCPDLDMRAIAFSSDGAMFAAGGRRGVTRLWQLSDGHPLHETHDLVGHHGRVRSVAFSPYVETLATAGEDRCVCIWRATTCELVATLSCGPCKGQSLAWYAPDRLAVGGSDNRIWLWNTAAGETLGVLEGHTGSVVALATDGQMIASAGYDTTVRLWKITEGGAVAESLSAPRIGRKPE